MKTLIRSVFQSLDSESFLSKYLNQVNERHLLLFIDDAFHLFLLPSFEPGDCQTKHQRCDDGISPYAEEGETESTKVVQFQVNNLTWEKEEVRTFKSNTVRVTGW